jgi:hypothetical protein
MSLLTLPPELHLEILFHFLNSRGKRNSLTHAVEVELPPYLSVCRAALACWLKNRRVILHRLAKHAERRGTRAKKYVLLGIWGGGGAGALTRAAEGSAKMPGTVLVRRV